MPALCFIGPFCTGGPISSNTADFNVAMFEILDARVSGEVTPDTDAMVCAKLESQ